MKAIPVTPRTAEAAQRVVWFEDPEKALADPVGFMACAMAYARQKDRQVIRQHVSGDEFRQALDSAPPGIIDPRSWAYWNLKVGRFPPPPLPQRPFDAGETVAATSAASAQGRRYPAAQEWRRIREPGTSVDSAEVRCHAVEARREKYGPNQRQ
jgi:hypothetical protein